MKRFRFLFILLAAMALSLQAVGQETSLPVKKPDLPQRSVGMTNEITLQQVDDALQKEGDAKGLYFNFEEPSLYGEV